MIVHRLTLRHVLAAAWLLLCFIAPLACNNDRKITEKHERMLTEEEDG